MTAQLPPELSTAGTSACAAAEHFPPSLTVTPQHLSALMGFLVGKGLANPECAAERNQQQPLDLLNT
eukprot:9524009-Karenia_brevis.AAC.1